MTADILSALQAENAVLREEIRTARQAAELTAQLVVRQFEETEAILQKVQTANAERQAVLDAASQMSIIAAGLDGVITMFSRGAETLIGVPGGDMVGRTTLLDLHLPEEMASRCQVLGEEIGRPVTPLGLYDHYARRRQGAVEEWTYVCYGGRPMPVNLSITATRDGDGRITGYLAAAMDITARRRAEEEARRLATYLRTVIETLPQGVSVYDEALRLVLCNSAFANVLDLPQEMVRPGMKFADMVRYRAERGEYGEGTPDAYVRRRMRMVQRFTPHDFERTRPNGDTIFVQGQPMIEDGRAIGLVSTYTDVTVHKRAEEAIRRANALIEEAISYSPTYVWEIDAEGIFTFVQGSQKVLGYAPEEMRGHPYIDFLCGHAEHRPFTDSVIHAFHNRMPYEQLLTCAPHKDGSCLWISMSAHPIWNGQGHFSGYRGVNVDVTELTRAKQELEKIALHDTLTGLANRRKFVERYTLESARQTRRPMPLSLLVADIDHFKRVNDTWGHLAGDACLVAVAKVLTASIRPFDMVARFGGEEFIALLPDTDSAGAACAAERVRAAIEATAVTLVGRTEPLRLTISIGAACCTAPTSLDDLLEMADQVLYQAKKSGRNRVCVRQDGAFGASSG